MVKHTKFLTHSGVLLDYATFNKDDINLEDIAHHLANERRFGGSLPLDCYYSVACHSLNIMNFVFELTTSLSLDVEHVRSMMKYALFHDASEAYLKDLPTGLKALLPGYQALEEIFSEVIYNKYAIVKSEYVSSVIDKNMFLNEALELNPQHYGKYIRNINNRPLCWKLRRYSPGESKHLFLLACEELGVRDE